jgi:hypothetical protein
MRVNKIQYKDHSHVGYCVYFLIDKKEIVYVGCTGSLGKRLGEHSQWLPFIICGRKAEIHPNKRITQFTSYSSYPRKKNKKFSGYGLCKKVFTHYSFIPINSEKRALKLESLKRKEHNPKYNNHQDYHWVPTDKKHTIYRAYKSYNGNRPEDSHYLCWKKIVYPETYYLMTWEKKVNFNSNEKIVQFKDKYGDTVTYNKKTGISEVWRKCNV